MVIREWRGRADPQRADAYPLHFNRSVVPELQELAGFIGATLSQRRAGDVVEFVVLTRWESMDSVIGFAGEQFERAVVEPGAVAALVDFDATVRHYDVIAAVGRE
jgi:heme-degrading monooxygenase HmoA